MNKINFSLTILLAAIVASLVLAVPAPTLASQPSTLPTPALVGVWQAKVLHDSGAGIAILSFAPDGTFYSGGDSLHLLAVAQGVWKPAGEGEYDAWYTAILFGGNNKFVGIQKTRIRITMSLDGNKFAGATLLSTQDMDGKIMATDELELAAQRIEDE